MKIDLLFRTSIYSYTYTWYCNNHGPCARMQVSEICSERKCIEGSIFSASRIQPDKLQHIVSLEKKNKT